MNVRACDILIIGAGPAGCAAALRARQAGLSVIIIEGAATPRRQPGETLHPGVEPLLTQLGAWERVEAAGFHRHHGVWVEWGGPRTFQAYGTDARGPWRGLQAERARFDALLQTAAGEAGAILLRPCRAEKVLRDSTGAITGVATSMGPIHGRWIADASGRRAWLADRLGLIPEPHSPPLHVRFGWEPSVDEADPALVATSRGWDWRAPLENGRAAWAALRISLPDAARHAEPGSRRKTLLCSPPSACDLQWRRFPGSAGPGYFLLGDAAAMLDPSSSHGVLRALMSGILAGYLVVAMCRRALAAEAASSTYREWVDKQFSHDTAALRGLWQRHPCEAARKAMAHGA